MQRTNVKTPAVVRTRPRRSASRRGPLCILATGTAALSLTLGGCGTDFASLIYTSFQAAARQALDSALTDFAGGLGGSTGTNGGNGNTNDNTNDNGNGTTDPVASGQSVYTDNGCGACHCADASGGCALAAPSLVALDSTALADVVSGAATHPTGVGLTNQQQADLIAYLASLP